jgi:hypothetical protein
MPVAQGDCEWTDNANASAHTEISDVINNKGQQVATVIKKLVSVVAVTVGAGALTGLTAGTASAWPIPITPDQQRYISQARAAGFPGDDDAVLQAGMQACHALYAGQGAQGAAGTVAGQAGVSPDQAAVAVRLARGSLCTQAPG